MKLPIFIMVLVIGLLVYGFYTVEVGADRYSQIKRFIEQQPSIKPLAHSLLQDGKITTFEALQIEWAFDRENTSEKKAEVAKMIEAK